jgi:uncharacterized protein (UPF0332 family)
MNEAEARKTLVALWLQKADEAFDSARLELNEGHTNFAVNRLYYTCFYAVTALLLKDDKQFARHSAVKAEFSRSYIKSGRVDVKWSSFYQKLFDDRQEGDYVPTAAFDSEEVAKCLEQTQEFLTLVQGLIAERR